MNEWFKQRFSIPSIILYTYLTFYSFAATLVSLHRFWQYEVFFYDFGIFDQAIWKVSRLQAPVIDHLVTGGKLIFADHFSPSLFLLSPLYWFTNRQEILLVAQALTVSASAFLIYKIGIKILKNQWLSLCTVIAYTLFIGLQNAIITDIHEVTFATLPLALTFYAIVMDRKKLYWVALIILLGFKENLFLVGIGIGLFILFQKKSWKKIGLISILLSIVWGAMVIKLIIPFFSGGTFTYDPILPTSLGELVNRFVDSPIKIHTLLISFGTFLFLPLLVSSFWFLFFQDFLTRFVPQAYTLRFGLGLHYSAILAPLLAISSIFALKSIQGRPSLHKFLSISGLLLLIIPLYLHQFKLHGPLGLAYNPAFYRHTKNFAFLDNLISKVPKGASVMTQNNLAVRFAHQPIYLLRDNWKIFAPDYIVLDLRDGQNPNNFFGLRIKTKEDVYSELLLDNNYDIAYQTDQQFVFRKIRHSQKLIY